MTRSARVLLVAASLFLACVVGRSVQADHVLTGTPGAPYAGEVRIFLESAPVPEPFDEIAIVSATGDGPRASLSTILGALRGEAADLGCNAVIRVRYDRGQSLATATGVGVWLGPRPHRAL